MQRAAHHPHLSAQVHVGQQAALHSGAVDLGQWNASAGHLGAAGEKTQHTTKQMLKMLGKKG